MAFVFLIAVLLNQKELFSFHPIAAFHLYVCSYSPHSTKSPVKQQFYMYLWYILVITCMFSANVQVIITSYLNHKEYNVARFEQMESLQAHTVNMYQIIPCRKGLLTVDCNMSPSPFARL